MRLRPVVTGLDWMGGGCGSIESALQDLVDSAEHSLIILAYRINDGALPLLENLGRRLMLGVRVTMVVNSLSRHPSSTRGLLLEMARQHPDLFRLYEFNGSPGQELHAKLVIADRRRALVGSANLSRAGLVSNYELAVVIEGEEVERLACTSLKITCSQETERVVGLVQPDPGDRGSS